MHENDQVVLKDIPTNDLVRELETRQGVISKTVYPYEDYSVSVIVVYD